jgi:hypothetical protein
VRANMKKEMVWVVLLVVAVLVKIFQVPSSIGISWGVDQHTHRGVPLSDVMFWGLLIIVGVLMLIRGAPLAGWHAAMTTNQQTKSDLRGLKPHLFFGGGLKCRPNALLHQKSGSLNAACSAQSRPSLTADLKAGSTRSQRLRPK